MFESRIRDRFRETFDRGAIIVNMNRNRAKLLGIGTLSVRACSICTFASIMDVLGVGYVIFETISFEHCVHNGDDARKDGGSDRGVEKKRRRK